MRGFRWRGGGGGGGGKGPDPASISQSIGFTIAKLCKNTPRETFSGSARVCSLYYFFVKSTYSYACLCVDTSVKLHNNLLT